MKFKDRLEFVKRELVDLEMEKQYFGLTDKQAAEMVVLEYEQAKRSGKKDIQPNIMGGYLINIGIYIALRFILFKFLITGKE